MPGLTITNATLVAAPGARPRPGSTIAMAHGRIAERSEPGAEAFGTGSGAVAAGEPADLVVLERLQEVRDLAEVRATIRSGRVIWGQPEPS